MHDNLSCFIASVCAIYSVHNTVVVKYGQVQVCSGFK